jgi:hypothetical protein
LPFTVAVFRVSFSSEEEEEEDDGDALACALDALVWGLDAAEPPPPPPQPARARAETAEAVAARRAARLFMVGPSVQGAA